MSDKTELLKGLKESLDKCLEKFQQKLRTKDKEILKQIMRNKIEQMVDKRHPKGEVSDHFLIEAEIDKENRKQINLTVTPKTEEAKMLFKAKLG